MQTNYISFQTHVTSSECISGRAKYRQDVNADEKCSLNDLFLLPTCLLSCFDTNF